MDSVILIPNDNIKINLNHNILPDTILDSYNCKINLYNNVVQESYLSTNQQYIFTLNVSSSLYRQAKISDIIANCNTINDIINMFATVDDITNYKIKI